MFWFRMNNERVKIKPWLFLVSFDYNNPTYRIKGAISASIFDTPALDTPLFRPWTMMPPLLLPPPPFSVLQCAVITRCASSVVSSWSPCLRSHLGSMVLQSSVSHLALYSSYTSLFSWSGSPIGQVMLPSFWLQQPPVKGNKVKKPTYFLCFLTIPHFPLVTGLVLGH